MDASELDIALDELETRLDRLRGLYDQYFMGLEKIEPAVARKDVDRRIWLLRKEKVRNTAKRFKLQTLIQRYNTFQQHWQRICREIDAGTYKRHMLRAEKQFGPTELLTMTSRRRFRHRNAGLEGTGSDAPSEAPPAETPAQTPPAIPAAVEREETARALGRAAAATTTGFPVAEPMTQSDTQFAESAATGIRERSPVEPKPAPPKPVRQLANLDLDLDFGPAPPKPSPPAGQSAAGGDRTGAKAPPAPAPVQPQPQRRPEPAAGQSGAAGDRAPTGQPGAAGDRTGTGAAAPAPSGSLDDAKLKQIHERLIAARKATDDQTPVSLDKLAKSLRDAETRLRAQHANRKIDFAVVIKDGKAIVKPVLR